MSVDESTGDNNFNYPTVLKQAEKILAENRSNDLNASEVLKQAEGIIAEANNKGNTPLETGRKPPIKVPLETPITINPNISYDDLSKDIAQLEHEVVTYPAVYVDIESIGVGYFEVMLVQEDPRIPCNYPMGRDRVKNGIGFQVSFGFDDIDQKQLDGKSFYILWQGREFEAILQQQPEEDMEELPQIDTSIWIDNEELKNNLYSSEMALELEVSLFPADPSIFNEMQFIVRNTPNPPVLEK